jgi:putative membrane protein insertion efficiency factor
VRNPAAAALVLLLKGYRAVVSPLYGQVCRYHPSCSAYALGAVEAHGAVRGSWLAARRLARCHPWAAGGVDPVPAAGSYRWWGAATHGNVPVAHPLPGPNDRLPTPTASVPTATAPPGDSRSPAARGA